MIIKYRTKKLFNKHGECERSRENGFYFCLSVHASTRTTLQNTDTTSTSCRTRVGCTDGLKRGVPVKTNNTLHSRRDHIYIFHSKTLKINNFMKILINYYNFFMRVFKLYTQTKTHGLRLYRRQKINTQTHRPT